MAGPYPGPVRGRAGTVISSLAAGGAIALAMPPWGWWPLAFVGFALFGSLLRTPRRRARFLRGWLVGAAWMVPSTFWMLDFSLPGYVFAGVVLSAYVGVAAATLPSLPATPVENSSVVDASTPTTPRRRVRAGRWLPYLTLPAAVAVVEFVRTTVPFGGVPLSTVAMSQAASPLAPVARIGGGVALTLVTVAIGSALLALWHRHWAVAAGLVAAVLAMVGLAAVAPQGRDLGPLEVAVVQGGGPQRTRAVTSDARAVFDRHLAASRRVTSGVDLVLWPENVLDVRGGLEASTERDELVQLARQRNAPVVAGIVESFPGRFYNASVVITPDGETLGRYDKVRRVPFGEYVPYRAVIDRLSGGAVSRYVPNDAVAGSGPATVRTPDGLAGIVISWEVFFERRARDAISNGGQVLLNPTNGSSYWLTIVQSQQVASSRLRALETGRWVLQAAPTGFSAVIDPDGNVLQRTGVSERAVLEHTVQRRDGLTWSVRFGPWPWLILAVVLLIGAHGAVRSSRSTRTRSQSPDDRVPHDQRPPTTERPPTKEAPPRGINGSQLQQHRRRPLVDQRHGHLGAEPAGGHGGPEPAQLVGHRLDQRLGLLGAGRIHPTGPTSPVGIAVQRELADHQDLTAGLGHRTIHDPVRVRHDPQVPQLGRQLAGHVLGVGMGDPHQHAQSGPDGPDHLTVHPHRRLANPLHHCSHRAIPSGHGHCLGGGRSRRRWDR